MTTILPQSRSPWQVIDQAIGSELSKNLPGAVQQGYQRQQGLGAIDQLQQDLASSGGDLSKMLPALARAYTLNPNLERSGLGQFALQNAKVNQAYPARQQQPSGQIPAQQSGQISDQTGGQPAQPNQNMGSQGQPVSALPSAFNIFTGPDIDKASEDFARKINDPAGYEKRQAQLNNLNQIATEQRRELEDAALKSDVSPSELSRFMLAGQKFDPRNPSQWVEKTKQEYKKVKSNFDKLDRAFIPGLGNALLGQDRERTLKGLQQPVSDLVKKGYEDDVREKLAENYMSPSEIEETIRPLTPQKLKAIENLPKGMFPANKTEGIDIFSFKPPLEYPLGSYEEAEITHPKELEKMRNDLSDFFLKNVDENMALLPLRDKIWEERDYDWQQFAPAIQLAQEKGLKLSPRQETEMADISTQPPRQSLPDIFRSFDRVVQYFRGNK